MKIGIVCAMKEELDSILKALELSYTTVKRNSFELHLAKFMQHELVFVLCGIGKVNAAIHTQYLIDNHLPDYIVNVGVAGSLSPKLNFGDVVIADDLVQHDMDVVAFGIPLGQIPRMDVFAFPSDPKLLKIAKQITSLSEYKIVIGRIATGDQFIDNKNHAKSIHKEFNALACEMEGAAVAQVCHVNQVPFLVVRALSDMAGRTDSAIHSYEELKFMTAARSSYVVKKLLELL